MARGMGVPASRVGVPASVWVRGAVSVSTAVATTATLAETRLAGQEGQTEECRQSEPKVAFHFHPRSWLLTCLAKRPSPAVESLAREF